MIKDSAHQIYIPPSIIPLVHTTASGVLSATTTFRVNTPDSRLRVKISIRFAGDAGTDATADITAAAPTLWLAEADIDDCGVSGIALPLTNIEGTKAAPLAFLTTAPAAAGLQGYSREFTTAADCILGTFFTKSNGFSNGMWYLQMRYQPDSVRFAPDEWDAIVSKCNGQNTGGYRSI